MQKFYLKKQIFTNYKIKKFVFKAKYLSTRFLYI